MPYIDARWEHVLDDLNAVSNSIIAGVPGASFASAGAVERQDRFGIGAGIRIETGDRTTIEFGYDGVFAEGFTDHQASIGLSIRF